jgi:hypothetical protein
MKNTDQSTVNSIYPDDPGHGVTREQFAKLIPAKGLTKIEDVLKLPSPSEGCRNSLIQLFWAFYINSLPEAQIKVSRKALKKELKRVAKLSRDLEKSAAHLWSSGDRTVVTELSEFVSISLPSQSMRPMHQSGIGFVDTLNEFTLKIERLVAVIPDDKGGNRSAKPFDELTIGLAGYYSFYSNKEATTSSKDPFFGLMAAVVDVLCKVESKLPSATFDLPTQEPGSLEMRLIRLEKRIREAGWSSKMCSCGHQLGYHAGRDGACILAECDCKGFDAVDSAAAR